MIAAAAAARSCIRRARARRRPRPRSHPGRAASRPPSRVMAPPVRSRAAACTDQSSACGLDQHLALVRGEEAACRQLRREVARDRPRRRAAEAAGGELDVAEPPGPALGPRAPRRCAAARRGRISAMSGRIRRPAAPRGLDAGSPRRKAATRPPGRPVAGDDAGAGQRQVLPGPGLVALVGCETRPRRSRPAPAARRGAGACPPRRAAPRPSAPTAPSPAPA